MLALPFQSTMGGHQEVTLTSHFFQMSQWIPDGHQVETFCTMKSRDELTQPSYCEATVTPHSFYFVIHIKFYS